VSNAYAHHRHRTAVLQWLGSASGVTACPLGVTKQTADGTFGTWKVYTRRFEELRPLMLTSPDLRAATLVLESDTATKNPFATVEDTLSPFPKATVTSFMLGTARPST
jgi:hypothetical protein